LRKPFFKYLLPLLCFFSGKYLTATHIVGGEVLYTHLGNNQYNVRLHLFIDCLNGNANAIAQDATAYFYVFSEKTGQLLPGFPISVARSTPERLVKLHYNCLANAPNACVDYYVYDTLLTLPPIPGGYLVSFQRCCRNNSITNLQSPGTQGANYWTAIPDIGDIPDSVQNTSAEFRLLPPNFLCTNAMLDFDHSAVDDDGDSLAYDLFWPYHGATSGQPRPDNGPNGLPKNPPFPKIVWLNGYDEQNPIDGSPPLKINAITGKLTLLPTKAGQYVAGIRVKEYRKGILIAETKRDYQFNVSECDLTLYAGPGGTLRKCDTKVTLENHSAGAQRYSWDFGIADRTDDTSNLRDPEFDFPAGGIYRVRLRVFKNNCEDSAISELRIGAKATGTSDLTTDNCSKTVHMLAVTSHGQAHWELDGEVFDQAELTQKVGVGFHSARAVLVDTFADCNDTLVHTFEINEDITDLRLANVFTPNGDGKNDCYRIGGEISQCSKGRIKIYNRWGELVFSANDLNTCWNGTVQNKGSLLPEGAYFYILDFSLQGEDSRSNTVSGTIELIR
jgi:gliding motility-associated-like protein